MHRHAVNTESVWWCLAADARNRSQMVETTAASYFTLLVSALMWACVSLRREMELLLRPPTTAISVLKFCNCSSFCRRERRKFQERGWNEETAKGMCEPLPKRILGRAKETGRCRLKKTESTRSQKDAGKKNES